MIRLVLFCFLLSSVASESLNDINEEESWLAENAENPDVTVTASGLQYTVLEMGEGNPPTADHQVVVNYEGKLLDGTVFDSTEGRGPATFSPKRVISGWTEGLQLMPPGSKFRFFIPSALGYGTRGSGSIPANSMLIFDIELLEVKEPAPETWFQKVFLQPVLGPIKLIHIIMFVIYVGMKFYIKAPSGNGPKCKASHILVKTEDEIKAIHERLKAKSKVTLEDFGKEAKDHSTCPSKKSGGDLDWFGPGAMVPAFDKVCFAKNSMIGDVLGPVKTKFGWHLIYIEDRKFPEPAESKKDQ